MNSEIDGGEKASVIILDRGINRRASKHPETTVNKAEE